MGIDRILFGTQKKCEEEYIKDKAKLGEDHFYKYSTIGKTNLENFDALEKLIFIGTEYGGYPILKNHLNENSVCYCAGAARDISFEEGLTELYNPEILIFEPAPNHFKFVEGKLEGKTLDKTKTKAFQVGLDGDNVEMEFYSGGNSDSWSSYKKHSTSIKVQMKKLSTLMKENNHSKIDVLKIDIEGSEYGVIDDIIENNLDIDMIAVEMHGEWIGDWDGGITKETYKEYLNKLYDCGYHVVWQLGYREHILIKEELIK